MAILRLFSALWERRGVPNRKKVAKSSLFLFLRLADRRDGTNPAKDESHTHRNQGMHLQSDKKNRPKAVSFSNIWLGQQDSRALRALSPLAQAPAGKSLKTCHRHVFFTGFHLIGSNPLHPARQQKTARRRSRSQIYGWASRIRTYITGTKNQGPAIGRWPSVCHKAFVIITYLAWSSQTNSRFAKTPQPHMSAVIPRTGRGEPIALLAPKTPRHSQQQH